MLIISRYLARSGCSVRKRALPEALMSPMQIVFPCLFFLLLCSPVRAESDKFPRQLRGFWGDKKATCDILRTKGPAYVGKGRWWLKITATDVLGSIQGRFFLERNPARMPNGAAAEYSAEIQMLPEQNGSAYLEELTLSRDGFLYNTIVGARASGTFRRC